MNFMTLFFLFSGKTLAFFICVNAADSLDLILYGILAITALEFCGREEK